MRSMQAFILAIEYYLPEKTVTTEDLSTEFPQWSVAKIDAKTGIHTRHIASQGECASDLGFAAARKLFESGACRPEQIDFLMLCTQSPDYFLPTTACLLQHRLGIPTSAGALDFNLGCSGFVYGLGLAQGLISSGQAAGVLLITAESYSKFVNPLDKSVRTIFGDAGAATFICGRTTTAPLMGPFLYGTDGRGGPNLIVKGGAMRCRSTDECASEDVKSPDGQRITDRLYMNGSKIVEFTLDVVPSVVAALLRKADITLEEVDLFVFHQANRYILEELRRVIGIPEDRFQISIEHSGNTVSSTIPIALKHASTEGRLRTGSLVMLVGFGVGYSWSATLIRWTGLLV